MPGLDFSQTLPGPAPDPLGILRGETPVDSDAAVLQAEQKRKEDELGLADPTDPKVLSISSDSVGSALEMLGFEEEAKALKDFFSW